MAWLAVDKDETEWISSEELIRGPEIEKQDKRTAFATCKGCSS